MAVNIPTPRPPKTMSDEMDAWLKRAKKQRAKRKHRASPNTKPSGPV